MEYDVVESWIDSVAASHSNSSETAYKYRHTLKLFCDFIGKTAKEIVADIEVIDDRQFRKRYTPLVNGFRSQLSKSYAKGTVSSMMGAIKSFFKYNSLPLEFVPQTRIVVSYHNRDITREEIQEILSISAPRSRAFFCMMAQSGLRPETLCNLKLKHVEPDFSKDMIPCKVDVPQELAKGQYRAYFTFMGEESVKYLKAYLQTRPALTSEDYLFAQVASSGASVDSARAKLPASPKSFSSIFKEALQKLKKKGAIDYEIRENGKPSELRLYTLRKFFRKFANQAGFELVQFWMGHIVRSGVEESYRPNDPKWHRDEYTKKAMPYLRFEVATPDENASVIMEQAKEIEELRARARDLEKKAADKDETINKMMAEWKTMKERYLDPVIKVMDDQRYQKLAQEINMEEAEREKREEDELEEEGNGEITKQLEKEGVFKKAAKK
jgi:integrase